MPSANEEFSWPWQYDFPPFFTLQPNEETRHKQMDAWCQLVLSYFQSKKLFSVDVSTLMTSRCELFSNAKINRKANPQLIQTIFDELHRRGNLEWQDRSHKVASIQWRKASSWAADIEKWVRATGRGNTVCTIYEITDGDDTEGEPFHGLDRAVITEALRYLEKHGKAEIMDGGEGVKFFI
ncbi:Vacuolar protein-sorting-associated protein 25 [Echinococcus granulosus]|uniref:Vacuolar protein-sorting-associated protein 25 n=1 Tax=Echinococcus granulosus TaxID=6210 RepID=W6U602_ECHGR|nr:Vacuolar protein-sorting-associated protein 25 [Echinococcus granulosus]EUB56628.1 Vacuolar protein-sorting-associated protein 25 [Echinococcus granulosus]